ncbi:hemin-degrading factor [Roseibium aquae]|nr:ChuX/HutX family heme-like substrate-binding protein [Roseibium aquae]
MRERDLARVIGITEADYVASFCGSEATRIEPRFPDLFPGLSQVGEVMALTRNESAVHEKIGHFEKFINGTHAALMLGADIDTRMFPKNWVHGFAVEKTGEGETRHSLQFFDAHGEAVQKIHARPESDMAAWARLVSKLKHPDQFPGLRDRPEPAAPLPRALPDRALTQTLNSRWRALTDPHQFHGLLKDLKLHRLSAFELAGADLAWQLDGGAVSALIRYAAEDGLPIMCFVGNRGCIQIHSGPIARVLDKGPWINVLDPGFHLHLRTDHISDVWAVRKPADIEHVTSVEAYDAAGNLIIQFFGTRSEGQAERADWRELVNRLPRLDQPVSLGGSQ